MAGQRRRQGQSGFTLLEMLIAVVVFAVVIGAVYGAHQATFRVIHGSLWQLKVGVSGRGALERLTNDLHGLVPGPHGYLLGEDGGLGGVRADRIVFVSAAHVALRRDDLPLGDNLIEYSAERDDQTGLLSLYRRATALLPGEAGAGPAAGKKYLLCTGLREVRLSYVDDQGNRHDTWQSRSTEYAEQPEGDGEEVLLPRLITIELLFADQRQADASVLLTTAVAPLPAVLVVGGEEG